MRLIDADALRDRIEDLYNWCRDMRRSGLEQAMWIVEDTPAVSPVKHGKWGAYEAFPLTASLNGHPCSECGMRFSTSQIVFMNYCPNCGARMDQEDKQ